MMKTGIDIVEISRFAEMEDIDTFAKRVFTKREIAYFSKKKNSYETIAGLFAAKEAFSKYMGSGFRGFSFRDIEIIHDELGKPGILFMRKPIEADVSISHSKTMAVAVVCGEEHPMGGIYADQIKLYQALLPKRRSTMHKGDCGRVFLLAGSVGMVGAATLAARATLRCGSGLVVAATPEAVQPQLAVKLTEAMTMPLPEDGDVALSLVREQIEQSDAIAIGPGLGKNPVYLPMIRAALQSGKPLVIDADGLNLLAEHIDELGQNHGPVVLTPHPGEMSRLCGKSVSEIQEAREETAKAFATKYGVTLLLKGKDTIIASPRGEIHHNPTGNSGMASGGMGDVLTGVIASLLGQGLDDYSGAILGAFLHGLAGDLAARELGEFGMIAGDVVEKLPQGILALQK